MKSTTDDPTKHNSCRHEAVMKSSRLTTALGITQQASSTNLPRTSLLTLAPSERRAIEAHKLQVEQRRVPAIENARRTTYV